MNLIGLCFGLVAYWPLFIPAKIIDILTPLTFYGFYNTLYTSVSDYVINFANLIKEKYIRKPQKIVIFRGFEPYLV